MENNNQQPPPPNNRRWVPLPNDAERQRGDDDNDDDSDTPAPTDFPRGDAFLPPGAVAPSRRIVHARRPPQSNNNDAGGDNSAGANNNAAPSSRRIVFDFGSGGTANNNPLPVFSFGSSSTNNNNSGNNNNNAPPRPSTNNNNNSSGPAHDRSMRERRWDNIANNAPNNNNNNNGNPRLIVNGVPQNPMTDETRQLLAQLAQQLPGLLPPIRNDVPPLEERDDSTNSSPSDDEGSMPPLEDIPHLNDQNNDGDGDDSSEDMPQLLGRANADSDDNTTNDDTSDDDMPNLVIRDDSSPSTINTNHNDDSDLDDNSMPSLEDFNGNGGGGNNQNRFAALNNGGDDSSDNNSSSSSAASSIPPLMNRNGSTDEDTSSSEEEEDDIVPQPPRFVVGGTGGGGGTGGRINRNARRGGVGGGRPLRGGVGGGGNNNNNQGGGQNNDSHLARMLRSGQIIPGGGGEEEEEEEDLSDIDDDEDDDDDRIHVMDDDDEEEDGEGEQGNNDRRGDGDDGGMPPGFRRFMEDMAGFPTGRGGGGGGGGGMFGGMAPPGFPGFMMGGGGGRGGPGGDDDDFPPFVPPFLRNIINMQPGGGGNDRNRNGNGRQRRLNTIIKPDGDDSGDEYTDSEEENFDGVCTGASRCAACFRADDQTDVWRRLVTLPCCGTDGKEESSSTRFCAACMLRMATVTRSDEPGATGEYDRWDDERYEYPVKKFYSKDNVETESRRFIECPRCRNLLLVKMMGLKLIPSDDDTDDEDACDCSDCVAERRERRANRPKTKSAVDITITKPPFKLKSWYIGRRKGIAKLLWRLVYFNHGFINLDALGGEEQETNVLKLITWGVLQRVPGKNNGNIYQMDKKEQALLAPLFRLPKNASEKDTEREKELYAGTMMDTLCASYQFLKAFRIDRSLRMLNQLGVQILSAMGQLPRLPLSRGQAIAVTALNIYLISMILQLSIVLFVYLFFFIAVGSGVCYGVRRSKKAKLELWQQGCIVLGVYGLGVTCYAVIRKVSFAMLYGLVFPKAVSLLQSIHRPILRTIDASVDTLFGFLPKVGAVFQTPVTCLVVPFVSVGLYAGVKALVGSTKGS
eukprot:scaffold9869_cov117-Skeletonema_dohrnii-CCMP3373.AAC.1